MEKFYRVRLTAVIKGVNDNDNGGRERGKS